MNQWKITAYTGKNRDKVLGHTWVKAYTESEAVDLGRRALKIIGVRGRYQVSASPYSPLRDSAFCGYLSLV